MQGLSLEHFSLRTPGSGHLIAKVGLVLKLSLSLQRLLDTILMQLRPLPESIPAEFETQNCTYALSWSLMTFALVLKP